uniref:Uncharacterized protein n=1 Tax=Trepomonas sp. PC1 TaxID=1076344 RepID=A0A146KGD9_9EUKA|eukprot:JAP95763.1 Hypothetical protein TPC1_11129 [Trepomonas sp. PC1]
MYMKRISLDLVMTNDTVLVGHKSNDLKYFNQTIKINEQNYSALKELQIGKYWLQIDPYGVFHSAKYQLKSYAEYLQEIYEFQQKVESSRLNTIDELLAICMRYLIPMNMNLVLNTNSVIDYSAQLLQSLSNFGLTSVDRAHLYKLKTDSFEIYEEINCQYPFIRFVLPIKAFEEDWDEKLRCNKQFVKQTPKTVYGFLNQFYQMERIKKLWKQKQQSVKLQIQNVNSPEGICIAKQLSADWVTTNLQKDNINVQCDKVGTLGLIYIAFGCLLVINISIFAVKIKQMRSYK